MEMRRTLRIRASPGDPASLVSAMQEASTTRRYMGAKPSRYVTRSTEAHHAANLSGRKRNTDWTPGMESLAPGQAASCLIFNPDQKHGGRDIESMGMHRTLKIISTCIVLPCHCCDRQWGYKRNRCRYKLHRIAVCSVHFFCILIDFQRTCELHVLRSHPK